MASKNCKSLDWYILSLGRVTWIYMLQTSFSSTQSISITCKVFTFCVVIRYILIRYKGAIILKRCYWRIASYIWSVSTNAFYHTLPRQFIVISSLRHSLKYDARYPINCFTVRKFYVMKVLPMYAKTSIIPTSAQDINLVTQTTKSVFTVSSLQNGYVS